MKKSNFLYRPGMTLVEAKMGRFMREGNAHPGAGGSGGPGIQVQQPNNAAAAGGNPGGDSGVTSSESNNDGDTFDPTTFWDSPSEEPGAASSGESASTTTPPGGNGEQPGFAQQLATQLESMSFGDPVFTPEIAEEINQGKFEGFEKRIQAQMQQAVRQALALNVQVLRPFSEQMMDKMREEFGGTLNQRDNETALVKDFPAAKDPRVAPVIKSIFDQALTKSKGNREQAVKYTKQMVALMANTTADDLELSVAPRGAGDSRPSQPSIDWLDELTGR